MDGYGGYGDPTTDGTALVVTGGYTSLSPYTSKVQAFSPGTGAPLWSMQSQKVGIFGYAAMLPGIAIVLVDGYLYALNSSTGAVLWKSSVEGSGYCAPVVVPSGVYYMDYNGNVYSFKLPEQYTGTGTAARQRRTETIRPLQHFEHRGVVWQNG
jgi:outer membrane protein assembly factor BamB